MSKHSGSGWSKPLMDFIEHAEENINTQIQNATDKGFQRIVERTPIDSGKLVAGWNVSSKMVDGILETEIYNDVEYAAAVNDGTTHVEGRHMVELTLPEIARDIK